MKKNLYVKNSILILLFATVMLLTSCNQVITENPYTVPEFDLMQEVYEIMIVETEDLIDTVAVRVQVHENIYDRLNFSYTSEDTVQRLVTEGNTYVNEGDIILIREPSDELEDELQYAEEDLELCMLRYEELNEKFAETKEGYLDVQLALIDIEVAQKELSDIRERVDDLTVRAPKSGVIKIITYTYANAASEFGNTITTYKYTYQYDTTGYVCDLISTDLGVMGSVEDYVIGDIIDIYDTQGSVYKAKIDDMNIYTYYDTYTRSNMTRFWMRSNIIIEEGVDYSKITILPSSHNIVVSELFDVILVERDLVYTLNDEYYVYVLDNGMKTIRYITVGDLVKDSEYYLVTGGLNAGDELITAISLE